MHAPISCIRTAVDLQVSTVVAVTLMSILLEFNVTKPKYQLQSELEAQSELGKTWNMDARRIWVADHKLECVRPYSQDTSRGTRDLT